MKTTSLKLIRQASADVLDKARFTRIDISIAILLVVPMTLLGVAQSRHKSIGSSPYSHVVQALRQKNQLKDASGKPVAVLMYNPYDCLNCNRILHDLCHTQELKNLWGSNIYLVYKDIRKIELDDYRKNLEEQGQIDAEPIDNAALYDAVAPEIKKHQNGSIKPSLVLYTPGEKEPDYFDLKDFKLVEHILASRSDAPAPTMAIAN